MLSIPWDATFQALLRDLFNKYFAGLPKDKHVKIARLDKVLYQA